MSFPQFMDFITPGTIDFYLNNSGYLTCDERHHMSLFQTFVVYYWERFSKVVGPQKLYKVLESIDASSVLQFDSSGALVTPPLPIYTLLEAEKKQDTVVGLLESKLDPTGIIVFIIGIAILLTIRRLSLFDAIRQTLTQGKVSDGSISSE